MGDQSESWPKQMPLFIQTFYLPTNRQTNQLVGSSINSTMQPKIIQPTTN
jgi:hypothetical protein